SAIWLALRNVNHTEDQRDASNGEKSQKPWQEKGIPALNSEDAPPLNSFYDKLRARGIGISTQDVLGNHLKITEISDVDTSDDESDEDEMMEQESKYPRHQQAVRDALFEISEVSPDFTLFVKISVFSI